MDNKQKNIQFLNEITNEAIKNNQPIQIHVYGDGPDKHLIENNPNIILHGAFNQKNIVNILSKIKVLLLPSKFEGFGLVIAEALANGIPCIIANTYLNASFLIDDTRGKLIDSFDSKLWLEAINKIMNLSNNEYNQLVQNCIEFAKNNLSLEQFESKWLNLINEK
ncbi:glycosyltransferase [Mycoplasmoides alvi]|uniref:glycosyltransferase n=1 Tax=Mycoplasmoides alvi TaxID=78580 RepID=UPI00051B3384|nr:glycosyltransferase [Mycoplasmoides alvi]